jgi:hypothetical protein
VKCLVDAAGQPKAAGDVPEMVDPPAVGDLRPTERARERGGLQLCRFCDAQQGVLLSRSSRTSGSTRSATGTRRVSPDLVPFGQRLLAQPAGRSTSASATRRSRAPGSRVAPTSAGRSTRPGVRGRPVGGSSPKLPPTNATFVGPRSPRSRGPARASHQSCPPRNRSQSARPALRTTARRSRRRIPDR